MSSRIAGGVLALIAAASIALSLLVLPWWAGHPTVGGRTFERKTVHITLLDASGHDERGDQPIELGTGFATTRYIELATGGVLVVSALLLAILALAGSERRQVIAKIVISAAGASIIVALALLLLGPDIIAGQTKITVPKDLIGMLAFWVGTAFSIIAGVLAMRPTPRVVLRPPRAAALPAPPPPPPDEFDVHALLQDDAAVRPSQPMPAVATSPSGALPGPSGPLAPLFNSAPQLRPLYDAAPNQGGSGGFVPGMATPPPLPSHGPTPIPSFGTPPPERPGTLPRSKPPSLGPPRPPPSPSRPPPLNRTFASAVVPPPGFPTPPRSLATPPPLVVAPPKIPKQTMLPTHQVTDADEDDHLETVERAKHSADSLDSTFDGAETSALPDSPADQSGTEQTDVGSTLAVGDSTSPSVPFESTSESPSYERSSTVTGTDRDLPTVAEQSSAASIAAAVLAPTSSGNSSRIAVNAPAPVSPGPVSVKTPPAPAAPAFAIPKIPSLRTPAPVPKLQTPEPAKVPISTAPDSLPPPSEKQVKSSGPSPACPQCESPMAWVEAHLRFYCKSCRMYF